MDSRDPGNDLMRHALKATAVVMLVVGAACHVVGNFSGVVALSAAAWCWLVRKVIS